MREPGTVRPRRTRPGASPRTALQSIFVRPIPNRVAKELLEREHYLHSLPAGTQVALGAFVGDRIVGALAFGVGPLNSNHLVDAALQSDCVTLTRLWLSDELPKNSESRALALALRALKQHTSLGFALAYADPAQGHVGTVYQAANWIYTRLSQSSDLYDFGDGVARHSRTVGFSLGTRSIRHLRQQGIHVRLVPTARKHRYVYFLDPSWRERLLVPVLRYPKRGTADGDH